MLPVAGCLSTGMAYDVARRFQNNGRSAWSMVAMSTNESSNEDVCAATSIRSVSMLRTNTRTSTRMVAMSTCTEVQELELAKVFVLFRLQGPSANLSRLPTPLTSVLQ